jgi:myo-inositol-1(or 4)-monophosphatase
MSKSSAPPDTDAQFERWEQAATRAGRRAAELIRANHGHAIRIGLKSSPTDLVTQTDIDAEQLIRDELFLATPQAGFIGEEGGSSNPASRLQWIIDPLDGTVNFAYGLPVFAVSIAGSLDGTVVIGVVVDGLQGDTYSAILGQGARHNGEPISVSPCNDLSQALVTTGFSYSSGLRAEQAAIVAALLPLVRDIRCFGSAALHLCWLAHAKTDGYYERDIKIWDYAAGALVAMEAGAHIELPCPENDALMFAATPQISTQLRELVGG